MLPVISTPEKPLLLKLHAGAVQGMRYGFVNRLPQAVSNV